MALCEEMFAPLLKLWFITLEFNLCSHTQI